MTKLVWVAAVVFLVLGNAAKVNADTRVASLPSCRDGGTIKASSDTKVSGVPMLEVVYSDVAGRRTASEYVVGETDHPLLVNLASLVPSELVSKTTCSLWSADEYSRVAIGHAPCRLGRWHVDNGLDANLKQVALYGNGITLVIEAFYNNFFNGPEHMSTDLSGAEYYEKLDQNGASFFVLHGDGPQMLRLGFTNLPPGHHEVTFGTLMDFNGQEEEILLGHVCF